MSLIGEAHPLVAGTTPLAAFWSCVCVCAPYENVFLSFCFYFWFIQALSSDDFTIGR